MKLNIENFYGGTHLTYIGLANEALKSFIQVNIAEKAGEKAELMDTWVWFQVAIIFKDVVRFVIALPPILPLNFWTCLT